MKTGAGQHGVELTAPEDPPATQASATVPAPVVPVVPPSLPRCVRSLRSAPPRPFGAQPKLEDSRTVTDSIRVHLQNAPEAPDVHYSRTTGGMNTSFALCVEVLQDSLSILDSCQATLEGVRDSLEKAAVLPLTHVQMDWQSQNTSVWTLAMSLRRSERGRRVV